MPFAVSGCPWRAEITSAPRHAKHAFTSLELGLDYEIEIKRAEINHESREQ